MIPETCPKCNAAELQMCREGSYVAYDLKFMRKGIKRWVVRYRYGRYRCCECRAEMTTYSRRAFYGPNSAGVCRLSYDRIAPLEPKGG